VAAGDDAVADGLFFLVDSPEAAVIGAVVEAAAVSVEAVEFQVEEAQAEAGDGKIRSPTTLFS
jgi:hypothetical protein